MISEVLKPIIGHVTPRRPATQHREHAVECRPMIVPVATATLARQHRLDQLPLLIPDLECRIWASLAQALWQHTPMRNRSRAEQKIRQIRPRRRDLPGNA